MNQRSSDKVYIAGWIPVGLAAGIEVWIKKNPGKNRTDFLIAASLEKLRSAHIHVDMPVDPGHSRPRRELPKSAFSLVRDESNLKPVSGAADVLDAAERAVDGPDPKSRRKP